MFVSLGLILAFSWQVDEKKEVSHTERIEDGKHTCVKYDKRDLLGAWIFENTNEKLVGGELILKENKKFLLEGWRDEKFKSIGTWNLQDNILQLDFSDNYEFWDWYLDRIADDFEGVQEIDLESRTVSLEIITSENSHPDKCFLYIIYLDGYLDMNIKNYKIIICVLQKYFEF